MNNQQLEDTAQFYRLLDDRRERMGRPRLSGEPALIPEDEIPCAIAVRARLLAVALRLLLISVVFGAVTGVISVIAGLGDDSLGVFAVGWVSWLMRLARQC